MEDNSTDLYNQTYLQDYKTKLSTDLLQFIDSNSRSPGVSFDEIIKEMEHTGQVRQDPSGPMVHVTITVREGLPPDYTISYLKDPSIDPDYHIQSGWVNIDELAAAASLDFVKKIVSVIPPSDSSYIIPYPGENLKPEPSLLVDEQLGQKLSTDLLQLIDDRYLSPGQTHDDALSLMAATGELRSAEDESEVMVSVQMDSDKPIQDITQFFSSAKTDSSYGRIAGWIPVSHLPDLAKSDGVERVMTQIPPQISKISSEGDILLGSTEFRRITELTGSNITVGIISDGVDGFSDLVKLGELPASMQVLSNKVHGNEGCAMLQIVHDIAPNATLVFHDRGSSPIEFVQAIDALINSGCKIICDDITYPGPSFEDGYISKNIRDRILSYGILYITSAGNFAEEHYQALFNGYELRGFKWHNFEGSNNSREMQFSTVPSQAGHVFLQWNDPIGKSDNNYDLFLYDESDREVGRSVNLQNGDDEPMEWVRFLNDGKDEKKYKVRVVQAAATDRILEIFVLPYQGLGIKIDPFTPADSLMSHQTLPELLSVAAVKPGSKGLEPEPFSSKGPVTIYFPSYEVRNKPDLAAPDQVSVSNDKNESMIFLGTSAAAPHIAGLAALLFSGSPNLSYIELKDALIASCNPDKQNMSWDPSIGYGIPNAKALIDNLTPSNELTPISWLKTNGKKFEPRDYETPKNLILYSGWNMISVPSPLNPSNNSGIIFNSIDTDSHTIWRYNATSKGWSPLKQNDTLKQMDVIWIYSVSKEEILLSYENNLMNLTTKHLIAGWNPIGVPGQKSVTAYDLFLPLNDSWVYIMVFDPKTQQYRPSIINGGIGSYSSDRLLYPTEGFWIYMNRDALFMP